jgi:hypothetical protein
MASIKRRLAIFSISLFVVILVAGNTAFFLSMRQIVRSNADNELFPLLEVERSKLESLVNGEIIIAMKMAGSPLIQRYFMNPGDSGLEMLAREEIAGYRRAFVSNSVFWINDVDKNYYSDDAYAYTLDTSDPDNGWYREALNTTEKYLFNVNYDKFLKITNLWINVPVYNSSHTPIGVLGTGINISAFIDSIYCDVPGKVEFYFFNDDQVITGAKNVDIVTAKKTLGELLGKTGTDIGKSAKSLNGHAIKTFNFPKSETAIGYIPALDWYIAAILPITFADTLHSTMTVLFFLMLSVIALIVIIFGGYALRIMLKEKTQSFLMLQNTLLQTMAELVERRDGITGGHIERTQRGIKILLEEIEKSGLYREEAKDWDTNLLLQSCLLHDIGKISIDDAILKKKGALTKEEFEGMKQHTSFGKQIIEKVESLAQGSDFLKYAKIFAASHHEKWDGTGYPHGLKGTEIPLLGRIMAFADVYDALTSVRPYKRAFTHEESVKIIVEGGGTQFDPSLVEVFLRTAEQFRSVNAGETMAA